MIFQAGKSNTVVLQSCLAESRSFRCLWFNEGTKGPSFLNETRSRGMIKLKDLLYKMGLNIEWDAGLQIRYSIFKFKCKAKTLKLMQGVQRSKIEAMKAEGKEEAFSLILDSACPKCP